MRVSRWMVPCFGVMIAIASLAGGCNSSGLSLSTDSDPFISALPTGSQIDGDTKWRDAGAIPADSAKLAEPAVAVR